MTEENTTAKNIWDNKTLIIAAVVVVLVILIMYFNDQKQKRAYELRRLERRVELLEEWGRPRQNIQQYTPPLSSGKYFNYKKLRPQQRKKVF